MASKAKIHQRTAARKAALAVLYAGDITNDDLLEIIEQGRYPNDTVDVSEYAEVLVQGVATHSAEIDACLASTSENWTLNRMPAVDRAILRLAIFEMKFIKSVPVSVAINEAVELAHTYGGEDDSSRFVNGILGCIARQLEAEAPDTTQDTPSLAAGNLTVNASEKEDGASKNHVRR